MAFYIEVLKERCARYKQENSQNQASFCNFIGMNTTSFSLILNGKRDFPLARVDDICNRLNITDTELTLFLESIFEAKIKPSKPIAPKKAREITINEEDSYELISDWEFSAAFCLIKVEGNTMTAEVLATRLDINVEKARYILWRLNQWNLTTKEIEDENYLLRLTTTSDKKSDALQTSHKEGLKLAAQKIGSTALELRDYSSLTIPINSKKIPSAKKLLSKFRNELHSLLEDGNEDEVYYFGMQLFPLSSPKNQLSTDEDSK